MINFLKFGYQNTSTQEKKQVLFYLLLLFISIIFEAIGFYGFAVLVKNKVVSNDSSVPLWFSKIDEIQLSSIIVFLIASRTIISVWTLKRISKIAVLTQSRFASHYLENLVRNTSGNRQLSPSEISRSIETSTSYIFSAMQSMILILGELLSITSLVTIAIVATGLNFILAALPMCIILLILSKILKPMFLRSAETLSVEARNYVNDALEASSISQVVFGSQRLNFLIDRFKLSRNRSGIAYTSVIFMQQLPRYILETSTIIVLVFAFTFSSSRIIASLTLAAPLLLRLLPSLIKLSNLQLDLVKGKPFLTKMKTEIDLLEKDSFKSNYVYVDSDLFGIRAIDVKPKIGEEFPTKPVNFHVKQGEILGVVGASGSGKTSLIECLIRKRNYLGEISAFGRNVVLNEYSFAYVSQNTPFLRETILTNLLLGAHIQNSTYKAREALELAGLPNFVNILEAVVDDQGTDGIRLSGGERARLSFARAIVTNPDFIILDELTAGLDQRTEAQVLETVSKLKNGKVIIIITHRESVMTICDKVIEIKKEN